MIDDSLCWTIPQLTVMVYSDDSLDVGLGGGKSLFFRETVEALALTVDGVHTVEASLPLGHMHRGAVVAGSRLLLDCGRDELKSVDFAHGRCSVGTGQDCITHPIRRITSTP